MKSAEWICTKCGTTNRLLCKGDSTTETDRCISCHQKHTLAPGERPVRWEATATKGIVRKSRPLKPYLAKT